MKLTKQQYETILGHARTGLPNEACGLLAGVRDEHGCMVVRKVYCLTNMDASRVHFSMDPKEQLAAIRDARENGWKIVGNFHSHPETPSRPSEEDKRLAFDPKIYYLILSLMDPERPVLRAFIIDREKQVFTEEIEFTKEIEISQE